MMEYAIIQRHKPDEWCKEPHWGFEVMIKNWHSRDVREFRDWCRERDILILDDYYIGAIEWIFTGAIVDDNLAVEFKLRWS